MSLIRRILAARHRRSAPERLSAYLDGELSERERKALEDHLDGCQDCREQLRGLRATVDVVQQLPALPVPRSFVLSPDRLASRERATPHGLGLLRAATAVAAMAFVVALSADVGLRLMDRAASMAPAAPAYQAPRAARAPTLAPAEEGSFEETPMEEPTKESAKAPIEVPAEEAAAEEPPAKRVEEQTVADETAPTDAEEMIGAGEPELAAPAPAALSSEADQGTRAAPEAQSVEPEGAPESAEPPAAAKSVRSTPLRVVRDVEPEERGDGTEAASSGEPDGEAMEAVTGPPEPGLLRVLRWAEVTALALFIALLATTLVIRRSSRRSQGPFAR